MRLYVLIIRLLIVRDDAQYVVHLVAPLLRLQATLVRMCQINVDQICEKQTQVRYARQAQTLQI